MQVAAVTPSAIAQVQPTAITVAAALASQTPNLDSAVGNGSLDKGSPELSIDTGKFSWVPIGAVVHVTM